MILDEVIEKENKIAEENQKIVDTQIVFDDVSISEFYCDDTEVIEEHLDNYKKCAEYHNQIVEWLEDYKHIKQWKSDVMDDFCKYDCNSIEEVYKSGYEKALFDIKAKMKEINHSTKPVEGVIENGWGTRFVDLAYINKIVEQLKAGVVSD